MDQERRDSSMAAQLIAMQQFRVRIRHSPAHVSPWLAQYIRLASDGRWRCKTVRYRYNFFADSDLVAGAAPKVHVVQGQQDNAHPGDAMPSRRRRKILYNFYKVHKGKTLHKGSV
jgi:hypothetical protein